MPIDLRNAMAAAIAGLNAWTPQQGSITSEDCKELEKLIQACQRIYSRECPIAQGES